MMTKQSLRWEHFIPPIPKRIGVAVVFVSLVFLSLSLVAGWRAWNAYHQTMENTHATATNLARSLAQHTEDVIKFADGLLTSTVERVETEGKGQQSLSRLSRLFEQQVRENPRFHGMFLFDERGRYLASSQDTLPKHLNVLDRGYFNFHRRNPSKDAYIGPPVRSKTTGDWMVTVSKRINHRDGSFGGVTLVTIHMDYFRNFHSAFDIGTRGVIFIAFNNGIILARRPFVEEVIGTRVKNSIVNLQKFMTYPIGTFITASATDLDERVYGYKYLGSYPLVAAIGLSKAEILADWRSDMVTDAIGLSVIAAVLGLLGYRLLHDIKIGIASEKRLIEEQNSLERLNKELEALIRRDSLTGLASRRHFDEVIDVEFKRAKSAGNALTVMLIDIDYFKKYNETYGHQAGDDCLKIIANTLKSVTRSAGDLVSRYGGEEFTVLLPGTDQGNARIIAQRICAAIEGQKILHQNNSPSYVTVSVGSATLVTNKNDKRDKYETPRELIKAADMALYLAKKNGCNRVCSDDDRLFTDSYALAI